MRRLIATLIAAAVLALPLAAGAATWDIDPGHSGVEFKIRHFFSKVPGSFTDYSGTIEFDPENPLASSVEVIIQTASVNTNDEKRDGHLQSPDFFNVEEFPEMTFKSTKVKKGKGDLLLIEGVLTMLGVEKPVTLEGEFFGSGPDAWGGTRAGFSATTTINRKDFGMEWNKAMDKGGAILGEDVAISIEIEAVLHVKEVE